jgi:hypothetical protein
MSDTKLRELARLFVQHNTAMVPTLRLTAVRLRMQYPPLRVTTPELLVRDVTLTADGFVTSQGSAKNTMLFNAYCRATRILHNEGVVVLAGTDAPTQFGVPGGALHDELRMLSMCGLSPLAALQGATIAAARFMKRDTQLGSIAVGKIADMVILADDPIAAIENIRSVQTTVARGRVFLRPQLDSLTSAAAHTARIIREKRTQGPAE